MHLAEMLLGAAGGRARSSMRPAGSIRCPSSATSSINETMQSDALDYRLETNPITQRTRLVIRRRRGERRRGQWDLRALARARAHEPAAGPGARRRRLVGRAVLARGAQRLPVRALATTCWRTSSTRAWRCARRCACCAAIRPAMPFVTRVFFDPNHGGVAGRRVPLDARPDRPDRVRGRGRQRRLPAGRERARPTAERPGRRARQRLGADSLASRARGRASSKCSPTCWARPCRAATTDPSTRPRPRSTSCAHCAPVVRTTATTASCST